MVTTPSHLALTMVTLRLRPVIALNLGAMVDDFKDLVTWRALIWSTLHFLALVEYFSTTKRHRFPYLGYCFEIMRLSKTKVIWFFFT